MGRDIELSLLVDNQALEGLVVEHGFSAWITVGATNILYDTGAGSALLPNAASLGIDLSRTGLLVLSHGHYDHTGGITDVLASSSSVELYAARGVSVARYSCHPDLPVRSIGMSAVNQHAILSLPTAQVHELHAPMYLADGIGLTGPIPRYCDFEDTGGPFFLDAQKTTADLIEDDQALWFETRGGLVIVLGCCHSGIVNTVDYIRQVSGIAKVRGIVGGLHLLNASSLRMEGTVHALRALKVDFLIPCHCTGEDAVAQLRQGLGADVVRPACAGMTFCLGGMRDS